MYLCYSMIIFTSVRHENLPIFIGRNHFYLPIINITSPSAYVALLMLSTIVVLVLFLVAYLRPISYNLHDMYYIIRLIDGVPIW